MQTSDYLEQLQQDRSDLVDNLETKGITGLTGDETFTELVPEVLNIPSGGGTVEPEEKDVNFYDYDGTRVYSYTKNEFLNLNEMPANPSHEGLTAEGWNWTLADAKTHVTTYTMLDIGQYYKTDDDKTRIYISLNEKIRLSPCLYFHANGNTTIEWGDGTSDTVASGNRVIQHTYSNTGDYVIKLYGNDGYYFLSDTYNTQSAILKYTNNTTTFGSDDFYYLKCIKKIELSSNADARAGSFAKCYNLETITIHNNSTLYENLFQYCISLKSITISTTPTNIPRNCFSYCTSIKHILLSNSITKVNNYSIQYCSNIEKLILPYSVTDIGSSYASNMNYNYSLKNIILPNGIATISQTCLSNSYSLVHIKMPSGVTKIYPQAFSGCSILYIDFSESIAVPTLDNINAFGENDDKRIIVPDSLYEDWVGANNWSTLSSRIIKKTDWDALNS